MRLQIFPNSFLNKYGFRWKKSFSYRKGIVCIFSVILLVHLYGIITHISYIFLSVFIMNTYTMIYYDDNTITKYFLFYCVCAGILNDYVMCLIKLSYKKMLFQLLSLYFQQSLIKIYICRNSKDFTFIYDFILDLYESNNKTKSEKIVYFHCPFYIYSILSWSFLLLTILSLFPYSLYIYVICIW